MVGSVGSVELAFFGRDCLLEHLLTASTVPADADKVRQARKSVRRIPQSPLSYVCVRSTSSAHERSRHFLIKQKKSKTFLFRLAVSCSSYGNLQDSELSSGCALQLAAPKKATGEIYFSFFFGSNFICVSRNGYRCLLVVVVVGWGWGYPFKNKETFASAKNHAQQTISRKRMIFLFLYLCCALRVAPRHVSKRFHVREAHEAPWLSPIPPCES